MSKKISDDDMKEIEYYAAHAGEGQEDIDLSDDEGHAGDDWEDLMKETGADQLEEGAGELVPVGAEVDPDAAGYRDILALAFRTSSNVLGFGLEEDEIAELSRAWGRVADHYLPECPTQESPLADALFTTGTIAAPRVLARFMGPGEEGAEPGQEPGQPEPKQSRPANVSPIRQDDQNGKIEREKEW